ncbi:MAG: tetratricopeptide repeat protein [Chloroflexota bacterium]
MDGERIQVWRLLMEQDRLSTSDLILLREVAAFSQKDAASHFGRKDRGFIAKIEKGERIPNQKKYRTTWISYLLEMLQLKENPILFQKIWHDICVSSSWAWDELTDRERIDHLNQTNIYLVPPAQRNQIFIERNALFSDIKQRLMSGKDVVLTGKPGVGKTATLHAVVVDSELLEHFSDGIIWASLGPKPDVLSEQGRWLQGLGEEETKYPTQVRRSQAITDSIGLRRMLLVIDDVWQLSDANFFRVGGQNSSHILTTRNLEIAQELGGASSTITIPELEEDEAYELLMKLAPDVCETDPAAIRRLVIEVGGLPLMLQAMGGYLRSGKNKYRRSEREKSLAALSDPKQRLEILQQRLGATSDEWHTLEEILTLSLEELSGDDNRAFYAIGAFAPKPSRFDFDAAATVAGAGEDSIFQLLDCNLLEINAGEQLAIHQVIAEIARSKLEPEAEIRHRDYYLGIVNSDREDWRRIDPMYSQIRWAWERQKVRGPNEHYLLDFVWIMNSFQERRGLWSDYVEWTFEGLQIAFSLKQPASIATLLNGLGGGYDAVGERTQAIDCYQKALVLFEQLNDVKSTATILSNMGATYHAIGNTTQALNRFDQALSQERQLGNRKGEARVLHNIGHVYSTLGQKKLALEHYEQALVIRREIDDLRGEANTLNNMAAVHRSLGDMQLALEEYLRVLQMWREIGVRRGEATTLNNLGHVYMLLSDTDKALTAYHDALKLHQETSDKAMEATTLNNIAGIYDRQGKTDEALEVHEKALTLKKGVGDRKGEATSLNNIAGIYFESGKPQQAIDYYQRALAIRQEIADPRGEASTLNNIARIYSSDGKKKDALEHYLQALALAIRIGDKHTESKVRHNIALVSISLNSLVEAEEQLLRAIVLAKSISSPNLKVYQEDLDYVKSRLNGF